MSSILYKKCRLCPRKCSVDRTTSLGYCRMPSELYVARAALHNWEEPPISASRGSGTIFLSGCSLGCIYCQNREISRGIFGKKITADALSEIMLRLEREGAHNVNFVTPTHYIPHIKEAIILARKKGLSLPIVYNTSSYEAIDALRQLSGLVDIYIPDFKYYLNRTAAELSGAPNYPDVARAAIEEMVEQIGKACFDAEGVMTRGVIVRILLLPGRVAEAKLILKYLYDTYGEGIFISLMSQYTPSPDMPPPLNRAVTREEYRQLTDYAERLGLKNGFIQDLESARESYIPPFSESTL